MGKEYVVEGAKLGCTMGVAKSKLVVSPMRKQFLRGKKRGNIGDAIPLTNIISFGACKVTSPPKPCTPLCVMWNGGKTDVLIDGLPALLDDDTLVCMAGGGEISIENSGQ